MYLKFILSVSRAWLTTEVHEMQPSRATGLISTPSGRLPGEKTYHGTPRPPKSLKKKVF